MKNRLGYWFGIISIGLLACIRPNDVVGPPDMSADNRLPVYIGGNAWLTDGSGKIVKDGLVNWSSDQVVSTYVRFAQAGTLTLSVNMSVPTGKSRIRVTLLGKSAEFDAHGDAFTEYPLGQWTIAKAGYVKIDLQGVSKTGSEFGAIRNLGIGGDVVTEQTAFVRNDSTNYFYWGRRGPSVHLKYTLPNTDVEWFYNEVTVPKGNDVIGSYFMANGFAEGYFGMQVNSANERRILFSVWSPFQTDDPSKIPDDQKIRLEKKGEQVVTNDFGNEGSGGQSYLRYNWRAGQTYKFLVRGRPADQGYTIYTAYFLPPDQEKWLLIASFKRPKTTTYLKSLHSFLENFTPETGNVQRQVAFGNQWVRSKEGQWQKLVKARFTGDATARKTFRMDYAGGVGDDQQFFLKNCGFFDQYTPLNTMFTRSAYKQIPAIDMATLP